MHTTASIPLSASDAPEGIDTLAPDAVLNYAQRKWMLETNRKHYVQQAYDLAYGSNFPDDAYTQGKLAVVHTEVLLAALVDNGAVARPRGIEFDDMRAPMKWNNATSAIEIALGRRGYKSPIAFATNGHEMVTLFKILRDAGQDAFAAQVGSMLKNSCPMLVTGEITAWLWDFYGKNKK